jgi:hypothetical protein
MGRVDLSAVICVSFDRALDSKSSRRAVSPLNSLARVSNNRQFVAGAIVIDPSSLMPLADGMRGLTTLAKGSPPIFGWLGGAAVNRRYRCRIIPGFRLVYWNRQRSV